ncbi:cytochrome P450 [Parahaliea mediterranea]|uniref:cytochrome P450 n=1 Tax=Parahaliea mediterranea TaxID=651086 RepID=UPI000E2EC1E6|nr:cytochrome P450 [Parahaliea mediterranea]
MNIASSMLPDTDFAYDALPDLHTVLDELRTAGPVVPVTYHGEPAWLITGYEALREAFADEEHFQCAAAYRIHSEPAMGRTIQTMYGNEHRVNRALVSSPFFPRQIRTVVESLLEPEAHAIVDRFAGQTEVDLIPAYARPYPYRVITRMLGIPTHDEAAFLEWALKLIDYPWDPEGALRARQDFSQYMAPIIEARRQAPAEDILSILATTEFEGHFLDDEEILSFCRLLFPAGSDTTYKNLGSLLSYVLRDPALVALARGSDGDREALVQEGLRIEPPTALLPRMCSKAIDFYGRRMAAGDWVLFGITAANSDPSVFPEPRSFQASRTNKNLAFGHGVHFCLGSHLARQELACSLKVLFSRYPDMRLAPGFDVTISQAVIRGPQALRVELGPAA